MASLGSSIRSAARATSSAYKRLPIRWRLAGGSAALTLVILCGFAVIVGVLTTRQIHVGLQPPRWPTQRRRARARGAAAAASTTRRHPATCGRRRARSTSTTSPPRQNAAIRVITLDDYVGFSTADAPDFGPPLGAHRRRSTAGASSRAASTVAGCADPWSLQYARRLSDVQDTANRVKVFLAFGVLGGALLALLAGLATARRAMEPIAELTAAARADRAHARPVRADPAPRGRRRGRRAGAHARGDARARSTRRARRPRPRSRASASSSPTPRTSCARR